MGKEPDEIRADIEHTRGEMSETVEAIGEKVDIPSRIRHSIHDTKESVLHSITGTREKVMHSSEKVTHSGEEVMHSASSQVDETMHGLKSQGGRIQRLATENPLGLAVGSVAVGFLAGMLLPSTRFESEKLGPTAAQVTDSLVETGREAVERGREVAEETVRAATDTAKERAQEEFREMKASGQEHSADYQPPKYGAGGV